MPVADEDALAVVRTGAALRLRAIDPLLPGFAGWGPSCGSRFVAAGRDGRPVAAASCEHWTAQAGSLDRTWGAARRFRLTASIASGDAGDALDQLLTRWRGHLAATPGSDEEDTAAIVTWPSRDVEGVLALQRHGLAPFAVIAARVTGRAGLAAGEVTAGAARQAGSAGPADADGGGPTRHPGLRIRRAGPADADTVARMGLGLVRYDAWFGAVRERPESAEALRREAAGLLAGPAPWVWLAERDGTPAGMVAAERPAAAQWIAPLALPSPVAYLMMMYVEPGERGSGVGAVLARRLHGDIDAAGVPVTLLHYAQVNPLSAPFWSQQGYRPLWTSWEAVPAGTLR